MARNKNGNHISRRTFRRGMRWAPVLFVPAPMRVLRFGCQFAAPPRAIPSLPFADFRLTPHYPAKSPLEDVLRLVVPGADEFVSEKDAFELARTLIDWSQGLKAAPPAIDVFASFLDASLEATPLASSQESSVRAGSGIDVIRRRFPANPAAGRERFLSEVKNYLASFARVETAEFEIVGIKEVGSSPLAVQSDTRYSFVGTRADGTREERIGNWSTRWSRAESNTWRVLRLQATAETVSRSPPPIFVDITAH